MLFSSSEEEEEFIQDGNLEELMQNYQPSKLSQTGDVKQPPVKDGSRLADILIGRFVSHPGNMLARKVIVRNREYFRSLETPEDRKMATDRLIAFFESKGMRFLEPVGKSQNSFRPSPHNAVMEKFRKSLRETGIRADRKPPPKMSFPKRSGTSNKLSTGNVKPADNNALKKAPVKVQKKVKATKPIVKKTIPAPVQQQPGVSIGTQKRVKQGDRIAILWPEDGVYYPGTVLHTSSTAVDLLYDDDERETVDLSRESFVILGRTPLDRKVGLNDFKENKVQPTALAVKSAPRRVSLPAKAAQDESLQTSDSSHSSTSLSQKQDEKSAPVEMEGRFQEAQAVPILSLADFLRRKMASSSA